MNPQKAQSVPTKVRAHKEALISLPLIGKSRFSQFKQFLPFSRETFAKLVRSGKAPKAERMGARCTYYSNEELHKFLADPLNYKAAE
jgi:predicted DNA-binding transcriptional regulator AlpA